MEFTKTENILIIYKNRRTKTAAQMNISNMGKVFEVEKKQFMNSSWLLEISFFILHSVYSIWCKIDISLLLLYQCERLQKSWLISFSHFTLPFSISRHWWATSLKILISSSELKSSEPQLSQLSLCLGSFQNESTYY